MNQNIDTILKKVALNNNTTIENVKFEINRSIADARSNPDPKIQAFWSTFPSKNKTPSPEEFIMYLANLVEKDTYFLS